MNNKKDISLIIKACVQDVDVLYDNVNHIVKQLKSPDGFDEIILALDIKRKNFLREYNNQGSWNKLLNISQILKDEGLIDRYLYPPENIIPSLNKKWFNLETILTHTIKGVPVAAQIYAFEQAKNNLILQLDIDIIIGRLTHSHSFLSDMTNALENNKNILSVAFNIYQGQSIFFTPYKGNFVPEVRFCLLDMERINKILPLPNSILEKGLGLSWYRAMEKKQLQTKTISVRGGDSRSFFIHPQNINKLDSYFIKLVTKRVEENNIPEIQIGNVDLIAKKEQWL